MMYGMRIIMSNDKNNVVVYGHHALSMYGVKIMTTMMRPGLIMRKKKKKRLMIKIATTIYGRPASP